MKNDTCLIKNVKISTRIVYKKDWCGDGQDKDTHSALVSLDVEIENPTLTPCTDFLRVVIKPFGEENENKTICRRELVVSKGTAVVKLSMTINNARLWSTWDYGEPYLYQMTAEYAGARYVTEFGIKELTYDCKHGSWWLNREKIYMRGLRLSDENVKNTDFPEIMSIDSLIAGGTNTVCLVDNAVNEEFFAECDKKGILVWQIYTIGLSDLELNCFSQKQENIYQSGLKQLNHACQGVWFIEPDERIYTEADEKNQYIAECRLLYDTLKSLDPGKEVFLFSQIEYRAAEIFGSERMAKVDVHNVKMIPNVTEMGIHNKMSGMTQEYISTEAAYMRIRKYDPVSSFFARDPFLMNHACMKPVFIGFEPGATPYILGQAVEVACGKDFTARLWLINDYHRKIEDVELSWEAVDEETNQILARNRFRLNVNADSAEIPDHVIIPTNFTLAGHSIEIKAWLKTDENIIAQNSYCITVKNV